MKNVVATILLLAAGLCRAQSPNGTVSGTITDPTGVRMAGSEIVVTQIATGLTFRGVSSTDGTYAIPSIPIGQISLTASMQGFKKFIRGGMTLEVGQHMHIDIVMELGGVAESVTVTADVPRIDTDDSSIGSIVEQERIEQLPLNGRHVFSLVQLVGGVQPLDRDADGFAEITNQGFSQMRINGGPVYGNQIMLDGGMNTVPVHGEISVVPSVDSIKEFKVETNGLKAEYGQSSGGVINVVTKSGTNRISGSAYELIRNDFFDARNFFAVQKDPVTGRYNPMLRYDQYGGTIAGPVWLPKIYNGRGKTFFFFGYEQWYYKSGSLNFATVPTTLERNGDFSKSLTSSGQPQPLYDPATTRVNPNGNGYVRDPIPGNIVPKSRWDPVAVKVLDFMPLPNITPINPFTNQNDYLSLSPAPDEQGTLQVKVDHRFSDRDNGFFRYSRNRNERDGGGYGLGPADPAQFSRIDFRDNHNFVVSETHIFSTRVLNEFRANATRQHLDFTHLSANGGWPAKLGLTMVPQDLFPRFDISGFLGLGPGANMYGTRAQHTIQFTDSLTIIRGKHQFKMGTDQRWLRLNWQKKEYPGGQYSFNSTLTSNPQVSAGTGFSMASFLLGEVAGGMIQYLPAYSFQSWMNGSYFQDDWKATPRLTLNLGIRYDLSSEPVERWNRFSNFDPYKTNKQTGLPGVLQYGGVDIDRHFVNPDRNNWGPRVGLAYALTRDLKTAVRAAGGILYMNDLSGNTSGDNSNSLGYSASVPFVAPGGGPYEAFQLSAGPPSLPAPLGAAGGPSAYRGLSVKFQDPNVRTPYQIQWNFALDRALPGGWSMSASYNGSHGVRLFGGNYELDSIDPRYFAIYGTKLQNSIPNPFAGQLPGTSLNNATYSVQRSLYPLPDYVSVTTFANHGNDSIYHAAQLTVQRRYANGMSLMLSYTKSKLIDEVSSSGGVQAVGADDYRLGAYNRRLDRAVDRNDISQRMVISGVYELPFGKKSKALYARFIRGWQLNEIATIQTGDPLEIRGANNLTGINYPDVLSDPTLSGDKRGVLQWFDTSVFRNPADYTVGDVGRSLPNTRGPGMFSINLSLFKNFRVTERFKLEFRTEAFNALNHTNLLDPNQTFSPNRQGVNTNALFGRITSASPPRRLQFGLRLSW
jgi:hypothetical protein